MANQTFYNQSQLDQKFVKTNLDIGQKKQKTPHSFPLVLLRPHSK